jgi:hypothetical protein
MHDPVSMEPSDGKTEERRQSERQPFPAAGTVSELSSKAVVSVRIADLGTQGCYANSLTVFPVGTIVQLSIRHAGRHFVTAAKVIYSNPGMGMGLNFQRLSDAMHSVLREWLLALKPGSEPSESSHPEGKLEGKLALSRLIALMIEKGQLTEPEGRKLLEELQLNR